MLSAAAATLRMPFRVALALPPRFRRRMALLLLLLAVVGSLYLFWFRNSSFVQVDDVTVTGLTTSDAPQVRRALESAAAGMSTLNVDEEELHDAVRRNPIVHDVSVVPEFPHGLTIKVVENRPVATSSGGTAVAPDGTLLRGLSVERRVPVLKGPLDLAAVAGAAPPELLERMTQVRQTEQKGAFVRVRSGPEIVFGELRGLRAKWDAAARVLADTEAKGATYIDVSLPERPVAGGLGAKSVAPVSPAETPVSPAGTPVPAPQTNPQPTVQAPAIP
ncbi:MAG: FtsQ-type POTRA domain-containing protein [Thermoleophilaceae bacterium]|nr:FtsQ-type POTRA domain-containing protein [Thermoleophilaceae bacterium]